MPEVSAQRNAQYLRSTDNRIAGALRDNYLVKVVQASKHMLRSPRGWAIDAGALATARAAGALGVIVEDTETGKIYRATWATIDAHGVHVNRGWGDQVALPLKHWQVQGEPTQAALFAA